MVQEKELSHEGVLSRGEELRMLLAFPSFEVSPYPHVHLWHQVGAWSQLLLPS